MQQIVNFATLQQQHASFKTTMTCLLQNNNTKQQWYALILCYFQFTRVTHIGVSLQDATNCKPVATIVNFIYGAS